MAEQACSWQLTALHFSSFCRSQLTCPSLEKLFQLGFQAVRVFSMSTIRITVLAGRATAFLLILLATCSGMSASPEAKLALSDDGKIDLIRENGRQRLSLPIGHTEISGLNNSTPMLKNVGNAVEFSRTASDSPGSTRTATITERFKPAADGSISWDVDIKGGGQPWTAPIVSSLDWPVTSQSAMWTTWGDPEQIDKRWADPLVFQPVRDMNLHYGCLDAKSPSAYFSVPIITFAEPGSGFAVSLITSPEDVILDMGLEVTEEGKVSFVRRNHRISSKSPMHFSMHLVAHADDWRPGIGWMVKKYPRVFDPSLKLADELAGCGAYSQHEGPLDIEKMKQMAFRVNWKASFDFPYMGMFLPPVHSNTEQWPRFDSDTHGVLIKGKQTSTSIEQMAGYSTRMRHDGFYVLNYFNATEFGAFIKGPEAVRKDLAPDDLWKDATTFLHTKLASGILRKPDGNWYGTWGGAVAMDPGDPTYQRFVLEQARRHMKIIPDSSGICIDRNDWLRLYNPRGDDGVSWINDKPARLVGNGWKEFITRLATMMHPAGEVIFLNPSRLQRVDMTRDTDGVYDEFGQYGHILNSTALMCVHKPFIAWTMNEKNLQPDPDAFIQRYLYLGAFPTAPVPGNDHTITPAPAVDRLYLDYGPLLDVLRGRKWVFEPHVLDVASTQAKANLFRIPGGYALPVAFGAGASSVKVSIRNPAALGLTAPGVCYEALLPGSAKPTPIELNTKTSNAVSLTIPLSRGCAMVRITSKG